MYLQIHYILIILSANLSQVKTENTVEIEIGGEIIDRHYGDWLNIWDELTITNKNEMMLLGKLLFIHKKHTIPHKLKMKTLISRRIFKSLTESTNNPSAEYINPPKYRPIEMSVI